MRRFALLAAFIVLPGCSTAAWKKYTAGSSPEQPKIVQAQKFVVVDAKGKAVAELGATPDGTGLALIDSSGKPRAALVLTGNGEPGLKLYDQHGVVRAALVVANGGGSGLALYDPTGHNRAALLMTANGAPGLVMFDRYGHLSVVLPARPNGRMRFYRR